MLRFILLTLALSLGVFMQVLDSAIANVAIPHIAGAMGVSVDQGTWVITSFAAAQAVVLPMTGWLVKRWPEHLLFGLATGLFALASAFCGLAQNLQELVAARVMQGAVSGVLIPMSQSLLLQLWPKEKSDMALSLWSMVAVIGPVAGPMLGGWITDTYSWRWIFLVNIPFGIFCCAALLLLWELPENTERRGSLDKIGLLLLATWVAALQIALDKGNDLDWWNNDFFRILALTACVSWVYFLIWELTHPSPLVDLRFVRLPSFVLASLLGAIGTMVIFGPITVLPLWLQASLGWTATWAGLAQAPFGIASVTLSAAVGWLCQRVHVTLLLAVSFMIYALTFFQATLFDLQTSFAVIAWNRFAAGFGLVLFLLPVMRLAVSEVDRLKISSAAGLFNFIRYLIGLGFGVSLTVTLWARHTRYHHQRLVTQLIPERAVFQDAWQTLSPLFPEPDQTWAFLDAEATRQAQTMAMNDVFWLGGWCSLAMTCVALGGYWWIKSREDANAAQRVSTHPALE